MIRAPDAWVGCRAEPAPLSHHVRRSPVVLLHDGRLASGQLILKVVGLRLEERRQLPPRSDGRKLDREEVTVEATPLTGLLGDARVLVACIVQHLDELVLAVDLLVLALDESTCELRHLVRRRSDRLRAPPLEQAQRGALVREHVPPEVLICSDLQGSLAERVGADFELLDVVDPKLVHVQRRECEVVHEVVKLLLGRSDHLGQLRHVRGVPLEELCADPPLVRHVHGVLVLFILLRARVGHDQGVLAGHGGDGGVGVGVLVVPRGAAVLVDDDAEALVVPDPRAVPAEGIPRERAVALRALGGVFREHHGEEGLLDHLHVGGVDRRSLDDGLPVLGPLGPVARREHRDVGLREQPLLFDLLRSILDSSIERLLGHALPPHPHGQLVDRMADHQEHVRVPPFGHLVHAQLVNLLPRDACDAVDHVEALHAHGHDAADALRPELLLVEELLEVELAVDQVGAALDLVVCVARTVHVVICVDAVEGDLGGEGDAPAQVGEVDPPVGEPVVLLPLALLQHPLQLPPLLRIL
mmetsp:Transcript_4301/g.10730  ORF Transcript_4301/g.10730 Transcript_4301/m.10730 type:complete len:528 (-) Transcript_4301:450-2033(-)